MRDQRTSQNNMKIRNASLVIRSPTSRLPAHTLSDKELDGKRVGVKTQKMRKRNKWIFDWVVTWKELFQWFAWEMVWFDNLIRVLDSTICSDTSITWFEHPTWLNDLVLFIDGLICLNGSTIMIGKDSIRFCGSKIDRMIWLKKTKGWD